MTSRSSPVPWHAVAGRVAIVTASAFLSVALMVVAFAWAALEIPWHVPDPAALTGPTTVTARDGTVLARFTSEVDRRIVSLEQVSEHASNALIASEDARFYSHRGVDPFALLRAVAANVRTGTITQGGSTLTQQYVKEAFVGSERTLVRKVREAVISIQLERTMDKDTILERYLNTVYFGAGAYGIEAAALTYFGKPAARLGPAEGATLAQLVPAPSAWNPRADPGGALRRRNQLLDRMAGLGMLSRQQAEEQKATPLEVQPREPQDFRAPYFVEYVRRQLVRAYGERTLLTGSLTVRTTLDLRAHRQLRAAVAEQLPPQPAPNDDVDAGAAAVDPSTGDILAVYGGRSFQERQFDNATQLHVRQPGSGFKPFVYATALEQGVPPDKTYSAPSAVLPTTCPRLPDGTNPFKKVVHNAGGGGYGTLTIRSGLENSVNTVYVQLGCDVGPANIVATARRMGVRNVLEPAANISIGGAPTGPSPLDMASAFGTLANDGLSCPARSILSVTDRDGTELQPPVEHTTAPEMEPQPRPLTRQELRARPEGLARLDSGRCRQALHRSVARHTTQALQQVVAETTATRAQIDRPQAGKTGTTNDQVDAWFTGYTPDLSLSIWVGHTKRGSAPLVDIAGFDRVFGGTIPALIWRDAATAMLKGVPASEFPEPGELPQPPPDLDAPVVGPARQRPDPDSTPGPTPTGPPTATPTPTPTSEPEPTATPTPTPTETEPDEEEDEDGGGPCLLFC